MALLHRATITPTKGELVDAWLPGKPWAPSAPISSGVSYRLDDPDGEVGMEGFVLTDANGRSVHVPLTYREHPLAGAEQHLLGTMEHSVLGCRWVYDGCGDPVWIATLATTIATGGSEAEEWVDGEDGPARREPRVRVRGNGQPRNKLLVPALDSFDVDENESTTTTITSAGLELVVIRRIGADLDCWATLSASWDGHPGESVLAGLQLG